jgi:hypothetical protein
VWQREMKDKEKGGEGEVERKWMKGGRKIFWGQNNCSIRKEHKVKGITINIKIVVTKLKILIKKGKI